MPPDFLLTYYSLQTMKTQQQGFTLIELMIVVLMLAILATIAYPSYETYVRQTRLENARADLMVNAQMMERYYAQNHRFPADEASDAAERSKISSAIKQNEFFSIEYQAASNDNYRLVATANSKNSNEKRNIQIDGNGIVTICQPRTDSGGKQCYVYK